MSGTYETLSAEDGDFRAYVAGESTTAEGIVLVQEIFGVNSYIRQTADRYAELGFTVIAPDLFWRSEPGLELTSADRDQALSLGTELDFDKALGDIQLCINWLRNANNSHVSIIGFCMGGTLAYLSALDTDADSAVGYYATRVASYMSRADELRCPVLLHVAGDDALCDELAQKEIVRTLAPVTDMHVLTHAGADHAFARPSGPAFNSRAAAAANGATLEWIRMT